MRFAWKVFLGAIVVVTITTLIVERVATGSLEAQRLEQIDTRLRDDAFDLAQMARAALAAGDDEALRELARVIGERGGRRVTLLAADGTVLADSSEDPAGMDNHADRPELRDPGLIVQRRSTTVGEVLRYVVEPVHADGGARVGFARVARSAEGIRDEMAAVRAATRTAATAALLAGLLLSMLLANRVSRPLARASQVLQALGRGDFGQRLPVRGDDEIGRLSRTVNEMAAQLQRRQANLDQEVNQREAILSAMEEGLLAIDQDERLLLVNPAARRRLGIGAVDPVGRRLEDVSRVPELLAAARDVLREGRHVESEFVLDRPGDELRVVELSGNPVVGIGRGRSRVAVLVLRDLTEIRRLEKVRTDFVANISHELKTPLTSMRGYVEAVRDDPDMPGEQRDRFLDKAVVNTQRLVDIVADLLDLAQIESSDHFIDPERLDLGALVKECAARAASDAEARGVQVRLAPPGGPLAVVGDRRALISAVDNLLSNAVKYSPDGQVVDVSLGRRDDVARLDVVDRGPGIPAHEQERIFERFYRVDKNRSRALGGTGLGLSIVRNVALAHGGEVTLESRLGRGSRFTLLLPLA